MIPSLEQPIGELKTDRVDSNEEKTKVKKHLS